MRFLHVLAAILAPLPTTTLAAVYSCSDPRVGDSGTSQ